MLNLKHLIDNYGTRIKYLLFMFLILIMLLAIRTYINYMTIIDTTNTVKKRTANVQTEMDYAQNFQAKYLASEYGHLFLAHDNNSLFRGESIISFKSWNWNTEEEKTLTITHIPYHRDAIEQERIQMTPQASRQSFIRERINWTP